jgi:Fungal specific transcription factor domain
MVFAIMFFQYATRNWEDSVQQNHLTTQSNMHYHYSLSMFYQLVCSHTYQDVQALAMICMHLRNFPKPGASWILSSITMSLAIELGMHRSVKRWSSEQTPNALDIEMRKRTFWSILVIHVTLSGKLGRPMHLKAADFDVEHPEPIDDDLLSEAGIDTSRTGKCIHSIGLTAWRMGPLFMELYDTIYAVRRTPETYIQTVNGLEAKLRAWQDSHPPEITKGESGFNEQEGRVFALYAQIWACEFRLLLRHPSVSMTTDPAFNAESMKICVETSRHMLDVVIQLQKLKSLDTTWYNTSVYVMAITLTLFAQWEKRFETTAAELAALRSEMDTWLDIMGDVGALLGES